jgi:signal transduction histidine kinase/ligand-binding sensor domain-containing protein/DNA-binding NarL/FixJ family response regulator
MPAAAQEGDRVVFRHLNKKDELAQSSVFAIAQDSLGYLWFGTRGGLNKYDGYRFSVYKSDATGGAAGNDVRILYVDPLTKDLWAGSLSSLSRYKATTDTFTTYRNQRGDNSSLTGGAIRSIFRDRAGRLWVGTSLGLNLFDEKTGTWQRHFPASGDAETPKNNVAFITEGTDGVLLVGTGRGLFKMGADAGASLSLVASIGQTRLTSSQWGAAGKLWIGTFGQGIIKWDPVTDTAERFIHDKKDTGSLSHNNVRALEMNGTGDLWVGTFDGLNLLKAGQDSFVRYRSSGDEDSGLLDNSIRSLLIDKSGSLWVGTYYGGVHHLDERYNLFSNFRHDAYKNSLSGNVVSSFAEAPNGDLWIGTEGAGLNYLNKETGRFTNYHPATEKRETLSGKNVKKLLLDQENLWIGTFRAGLNRLNTRSGEFFHYRHDPTDPSSLASDNVYGLHREGDLLWILTFGGGLDILDLKDGGFRHFPHDPEDSNTISYDETRGILKGADGTFWIGTEQGLSHVVADSSGYPSSFETLFPSENIYSMHEDGQHRLLLGTFSNGLFRYDPGGKTTEHYTMEDGLPGNTIFGILETDDGMFWLSTNKGLSRFDPTLSSFTNYDYSHGLENLEYNFNAYHRTEEEELFFGGLNGFTRFAPADIMPNSFVPPVVITSLRRNNQEEKIGVKGGLLTKNINDTKTLTFRHGEAAFTIQFAALDYFSPENNHYAYMLEGLERGWNYTTGKSEASYTIQREGDYTFLMKGGNSDGIWNHEIRRLEIRVMPPPWRSWWAYLIYAGGIALMVYSLIHFLRLRHKIQLQEIAKEQQDELLEMKLRFFTNITHEFRTPLTLILGPLQQLLKNQVHAPEIGRQLSMIDRNAQRLLSLVNQILTFRTLATDHESMRIRKNDAADFLEGVFVSFRETARLRDIRFEFYNKIGKTELWLDHDKMEKVFFNLLSNAFKFTTNGGRITVWLEEDDDNERVVVRIKDSGPGVDPALKTKIFNRFYEESTGQQSSTKSSGIGLAFSLQMVTLHQGEIYVVDTLPGDEQGAEFVVELKKGKAHFETLEINEVEFTVPEKDLVDGPGLLLNASPAPAAAPIEKEATLLIVDDNQEILNYLHSIFEGSYQVVVADSGVTGLEQARKALPDVIISDVMMPEMDGFTFCHSVKTDLQISHIPIILLTARTAEPSRIEGLRTGADDYVTKPFHPEELQLRVRNIIRSRQKAREKFARVISFDPNEITITNADEQFIEQVMAVVEAEMGNYDFKVDDFATQLAVSRSLLFTKLKALTGMTPNNFVKSIRLKRAAQLLESGQLNVSQVAYEVGFKDPKYFRKCFKVQFDKSPSTFGKHAR